jgi:hypothetical protein
MCSYYSIYFTYKHHSTYNKVFLSVLQGIHYPGIVNLQLADTIHTKGRSFKVQKSLGGSMLQLMYLPRKSTEDPHDYVKIVLGPRP